MEHPETKQVSELGCIVGNLPAVTWSRKGPRIWESHSPQSFRGSEKSELAVACPHPSDAALLNNVTCRDSLSPLAIRNHSENVGTFVLRSTSG